MSPRTSALIRSTNREILKVPVTQLHFDPLNPRLPRRVDASSRVSVLEWMLDDGLLLELMGSIGAQGYFEGEPLLVVPRGKRTGAPTYTVVEGNRRLAAVLLLLHPNWARVRRTSVAQVAREAKQKPVVLPVVIFAERDEIVDYLGYRHVTGIKEWDPLAKARYVRQLAAKVKRKDVASVHRQLAKQIGSRPDYVARLLSGLRVFEYVEDKDFYRIKGLDEETVDFSVLTTALSYSSIANFVGLRNGDGSALNNRNLKELVVWLFRERPSGTTVLGESRNLRKLALVVKEKEALSALREGLELDEAALLTDEPLRVFRRLLGQSESSLRTALDQFHRVSGLEDEDMEFASRVSLIARDLTTLVRARLRGVE
jgi:hypothetical protein